VAEIYKRCSAKIFDPDACWDKKEIRDWLDAEDADLNSIVLGDFLITG